MRFRLLHRRLTISAPRMSVRSALPWPFRWALLAVMLGFCAAIGLWAFEFGKDIAGLERGSKEEVNRLNSEIQAQKSELATLKRERDKAQSIANTADALVTAEKAAREGLIAQNKQLEQENQSLRDGLGFFEKLIPSNGVDGLAIRGLQAELQGASTVRWQVLVMQTGKNPAEFNGHLEFAFTGLQNGKPWSATLPGTPPPVKVRQYGRIGGEYSLPGQVQLKGVSVKVMEGAVVRATHAIKL